MDDKTILFLSARTQRDRDVVFLRWYAEQVSANKDRELEIPSIRAAIIEAIADRIEQGYNE